MSRERLADAYEEQAAIYARLADATAQIAHELRGVDTPAARAGAGAAGAKAVPPQPSAAPVYEVSPFDTDASPPLKPQVDAGLSICPVHGKSWTVKAAGVSPRTKEPFDAFYRCAEKDEDGGYCKQKPQKVWRDAHPIQGAAAA